ncbi:MAG: alpha-galactosidase [Verrucomicrobiaceae bacterium]
MDYGFDLMQIDDGWQRSSRDFSDQRGGSYSAGMAKTAATITGAGMRAGLWFIPFGWDPKSDVFNGHQDWFVHRKDGGGLYSVQWGGTCLDMTHPEARDLLRRTVTKICGTWGYKYIKIDGLWTGLAAEILYADPRYRDDKLGDAVFHDPAQTNVESYRNGLRLVREAAGKDVYVLGCNTAQNYRTLGASFGLVDGMRVGQDIGVKWPQILNAATMSTRLYFLHNRVWHNDPDCLMLRDPMTLTQARTWGTWIGLSGQLNIVSEWLPGLPEEKLDIVRRTMPNHGLNARPLDLLEQPKLARVWHLGDARGSQRRDVLGFFNWDNKETTISLELTRAGLDPKASYHGFDYWNDRFISPISGKLDVNLPAHGCADIALVPDDSTARIVSTSRHVSQGAVDLMNETWDPAAKTLTATSKVVANDPYQIRVAFPLGLTLEKVTIVNGAGATISIEQEPQHARITIRSQQTGTLNWKASFK